jgi:hypothetical protein
LVRDSEVLDPVAIEVADRKCLEDRAAERKTAFVGECPIAIAKQDSDGKSIGAGRSANSKIEFAIPVEVAGCNVKSVKTLPQIYGAGRKKVAGSVIDRRACLGVPAVAWVSAFRSDTGKIRKAIAVKVAYHERHGQD